MARKNKKNNTKNNRGGKGKNNNGNNPVVPKGNKWSKPVNPGAKGSKYLPAANVRVNDMSSAWYKTVLNPAHVRSYGCKGIPDENRNPTSVLDERKDITISSFDSGTPTWVYEMDWFMCPSIASRSYDGAYDNKGTRAKTVKVAPKAISGQPDFAQHGLKCMLRITAAHIDRVEMFSCAHMGLVIRLIGSFQGSYNTGLWYVNGNDWVKSADSKLDETQMMFGISGVIDQNLGFTARPVGCSVTVDNVTPWSYLGGYYTAGHIPMMVGQLQEENFQDKMDDLSYTLPGATTLQNYVTYTGQTSAGAYCISRPRNVHAMCWFGPITRNELCSSSEKQSQPQFYMRVPWCGIPDTAWDVAYVIWHPTSTQWSLLCTSFEVLEIMRSYAEGGCDGARYDKIAMDHLIAVLDYCDMCFEAGANDMNKVMSYIRRAVKRYKDPILSAMGIAGSPRWLNGITSKLIDHLAD